MKNKAATLATVIDRFLPVLNTKAKLPAHTFRCLDAIQKCRTPYMGGHIEACNSCGEIREPCNSCRNRHCPQCGAIEKEKWVLSREADLLPVKYFHVVFTVSDRLNELFIHHKRLLYNLLFTTVWDVMKGFGDNKKLTGGKMGITVILNTWSQEPSLPSAPSPDCSCRGVIEQWKMEACPKPWKIPVPGKITQ